MNAWIVTGTAEVAGLVALAAALGGTTTLVAVGLGVPQVAGVDAVVRVAVPDGVPVEALAPAVAALVAGAAASGDVVLAPNRPAERVLAAAVAVRWGAPLVTGATGFAGGAFAVARHGGIAVEHVAVDDGLVVLAEGGGRVGGDASGPGPAALPAAPVAPDAPDAHPLVVVAQESDAEASADLAGAPRIVARGRGVDAATAPLVGELARLLRAEVALTRPVAEASGTHTYVGVSGTRVRPDLYVALGVSGQLQHLAGVDARTLVAVDRDPAAPIFAHADYGIVGDAAEVVPALLAALG